MKHSLPSRFFVIISGALLALSLTGCMPKLLELGLSQAKAPNAILIHPNPKVGDYAITGGKAVTDGKSVRAVVRFEIVDTEGNLYVIRQTNIENHNRAMEDYGFDFCVDDTGKVHKAFLLRNVKSGSPERGQALPVTAPGETLSIAFSQAAETKDTTLGGHVFEKCRIITGTTRYDHDPNTPRTRFQTTPAESWSGTTRGLGLTTYVVHDAVPFLVIYSTGDMEAHTAVTTTNLNRGHLSSCTRIETLKMENATVLMETGNTLNKTRVVYSDGATTAP